MKVNHYDWTGKKVLVTGVTGFKGAWLAATLVELGAKVYGTMTPRSPLNVLSAYKVLAVSEKIVKLIVDITDRQQVSDMLNSVNP